MVLSILWIKLKALFLVFYLILLIFLLIVILLLFPFCLFLLLIIFIPLLCSLFGIHDVKERMMLDEFHAGITRLSKHRKCNRSSLPPIPSSYSTSFVPI